MKYRINKWSGHVHRRYTGRRQRSSVLIKTFHEIIFIQAPVFHSLAMFSSRQHSME